MKLLTGALLALFVSHAAAADLPKGWFKAGTAPAAYDMGTQPGADKGTWNAYIKAQPSPEGFGTLMQMVDATAYRGKRVRLTGRLRTQDAASGQMWMRVDGADGRPVALDNMQKRALHGNTGWTPCTVVLDVPSDARAIGIGFILQGSGEVLADQFRLDVVGDDVPVTDMMAKNNGRALPTAPVNLGFSP